MMERTEVEVTRYRTMTLMGTLMVMVMELVMTMEAWTVKVTAETKSCTMTEVIG